MSDRREEIFKAEFGVLSVKPTETLKNVVFSAMDEYMKECCLELLEYMAKSGVECYIGKNGECGFYVPGNVSPRFLTKEQLFENFL